MHLLCQSQLVFNIILKMFCNPDFLWMAKISPVMWGECNYNYLNILEHRYKHNVSHHTTMLCTPPKFYKIIFFRTCLFKSNTGRVAISWKFPNIKPPTPLHPTPSPSSTAGFGPSFAKGFDLIQVPPAEKNKWLSISCNLGRKGANCWGTFPHPKSPPPPPKRKPWARPWGSRNADTHRVL